MADTKAPLTLSPEAAAFEAEAAAFIAVLLAEKRAKGLRITTVDEAGHITVENAPTTAPSAAETNHGLRGHAA